MSRLCAVVAVLFLAVAESSTALICRVVPLVSCFVLLIGVTNAFAEAIFTATFSKGSEQIDVVRSFDEIGGAAVMSFTNGAGIGFDGVKHGTISLNGIVIFGSQDFKIDGTIIRNVALENGTNTVRVQLGGPAGQVTIEVSRGEPALQFAAGTIFVSTIGVDDSRCGITRFATCRTIKWGIFRAGVISGRQVVVASGIYPENIALVSGVHVLGGFDNEFSRRDIASMRPIIRGSAANSSTVSAVNIVTPTLFEGFLVLGPVVATGNSIGIEVRNSTIALQVVNNILFGGVGGAGAVGVSGVDGTDAGDGSRGFNAGVYAGVSFLPGGAGGAPFGGKGGDSTEPIFNSLNGAGLSGGPGGGGGAPGLGGRNGRFELVGGVCLYALPSGGIDGHDGQSGLRGSDGGSGSAGVDGALSLDNWVTGSGNVGNPGTAGRAGGGGGAGGGAAGGAAGDCNPAVFGPSGGGGGGGGTSGSGSAGGKGGGAAFGIFIFLRDAANIPVVGANQIYLGIGGPGGNGGNAGVGGEGALGAPGGLSGFGSGKAGAGGKGGNGGHGGPGGGGAGGLSVGLFANFEHQPYDLDNEIITSTGVAGPGGSGGLSFGFPGVAGQPGQIYRVRWLGP